MKRDWREFWFGIKPPKTREEKLKALKGQSRDLFIATYVLGIPIIALDSWCSARWPWAWGLFTFYNLGIGLSLVEVVKRSIEVKCKIKRLEKKCL